MLQISTTLIHLFSFKKRGGVHCLLISIIRRNYPLGNSVVINPCSIYLPAGQELFLPGLKCLKELLMNCSL